MQKVSVVIPAYNEEKWIGRTLEAILAQDYSNYEVIVVDNASTDKTSDIVRGFSDARLKLISEPRKGILFAREAGRHEASGSIIAQLDADCVPRKNWVANGAKILSRKNVVAATGPYLFYDKKTIWIAGVIGQWFYYFVNLLTQFFKKGAVLIGGSTFIRADILEKIGGYDTSIDFWGEDTNTARRISKHGWVVYSWKISLNTSARRFTKLGFFSLSYLYLKNFFKNLNESKKDPGIETNHPR